MTKKNKQAIVIAVVGLVGLMAMKKRSAAKKVNDIYYDLEGKGWKALLTEIDAWIPNVGTQNGRNSGTTRADFLKEALPDSVTYEDYLKFANGAPLAGGYTQQDRMLLGDTFS